jgi:hypothetical protein
MYLQGLSMGLVNDAAVAYNLQDQPPKGGIVANPPKLPQVSIGDGLKIIDSKWHDCARQILYGYTV